MSSFADAYLRAQRLKQEEDQNDLRFSLAAKQLNDQKQEQEDLSSLARAYQERRAQTGVDPLAVTRGPGGPPVPVSAGGDPAGAGVAPAGTPGPSMPGPAPAPMASPAPRGALLDALSPEVAGRILSRPTSRVAFKDLDSAERELEQDRNRKQADAVFAEANAAVKAGNVLEFYDKASRGLRILGQHDRAGAYLEHALSLRQDKEEAERANSDLKGWLGAKSRYDADPTPENYQGFLDSLSTADSKAGRALRQQILSNVVAKTFDQNPQVTAFNRSIAGGYMEAFNTGKQPDAEAIFRAAAAANPKGFSAYMFDAMANGKRIPEVVLKKVLRWDVPDAKEIPKDVYSFAYARTVAKMPGVRPDDPRFMEVWNSEIVRRERQMTEAKTRDDGDKDLRADLDSLRKRLADVRTNLRQQGLRDEDPERHRELLEEERQVKADIAGLEDRARQRGTLGPKADAPLPKAQASRIPRPKADDAQGVQNYKAAAKSEFNRLVRSGLAPEAAIAAMKRSAWDIE